MQITIVVWYGSPLKYLSCGKFVVVRKNHHANKVAGLSLGEILEKRLNDNSGDKYTEVQEGR